MFGSCLQRLNFSLAYIIVSLVHADIAISAVRVAAAGILGLQLKPLFLRQTPITSLSTARYYIAALEIQKYKSKKNTPKIQIHKVFCHTPITSL